MSRNHSKDILLDYAFISLMPKEIDLIIIGGGRAGYIKARSFVKKGFDVTVVSRDFDKGFNEFTEDDKIKLIKDKYKINHILDKHLVIIATDDELINESIKKDCDKYYKIYLNASDHRDGKFITPVEGESENIKIGIHTNIGSPKTSLYLGEKIKETIGEYDDFIEFIGKLREEVLYTINDRSLNLEIMKFVNTDDFYFFYKKDKHKLILKLFWGDYFDFKDSN